MMLEWIQNNDLLLWALGIGSVITFFGSLLLVPILVIRIPADFLLARDERREHRKQEHPALRLIGLVVKNALGLILVTAGIAMLALPGQGLLTIFIGMMLLNFPGKRTFLRRILGQPKVLGVINTMRAKADRPPLQFEESARSLFPPD